MIDKLIFLIIFAFIISTKYLNYNNTTMTSLSTKYINNDTIPQNNYNKYVLLYIRNIF